MGRPATVATKPPTQPAATAPSSTAARVAWHGLTLCRRGHATREPADLDAGVTLLREAVGRCHDADPRQGTYHLLVALGLMMRYECTRDDGDAEEAHRHVELGAFIAHPYDPITAQFKDAYASIRSARAAHRRHG